MQLKFLKFDRRFNIPIIVLITLLIVIILSAIIIYIAGIKNEISFCVFKNITGIPCPSCGLTRSVISLLHGNIIQAVLYNPFFFIGFLLLILFTIAGILIRFIFKIKIKIDLNRIEKISIVLILIILLLANWIYLIIDKR